MKYKKDKPAGPKPSPASRKRGKSAVPRPPAHEAHLDEPLFDNLFGGATGGEEETLSQQVFVVLRNEILTGRIAPGTRLVRRAIAKRLHVSTIPVVEALLRLEMDGLVENVPHVGARVVEITLDVLRGDRMLREAIECQVARTLAEMGDRAPVEVLMARAELLDEIEEGIGRDNSRLDDSYLFAHFNFHIALAEATGWQVLTDSMRGIWFRRIMVSIAQNKEWFDVPRGWHAQLVGAIASGDPDRAEAKMREHVRHSRDRVRDSLKETIRQNQRQWLERIGALTGARVSK